jgi:tRNA threonylcarbamoyladenosine biosynthesis protein TsaE
MSLELLLPDPSATSQAGFLLGRALLAEGLENLLITCQGPLGAGKTTFCQGLGRALGTAPGAVKSPTFSLAHQYPGTPGLAHLDLYRLGERAWAEFAEAGLEEYLTGICLVEWPEKLPWSFWPEDRLELALALPESGSGRLLAGLGRTEAAREIWEMTARSYWERKQE